MPVNYLWEAETPAGEIVTKGGDLSGMVRFSLIPGPGVILPRHDFIGAPLVSRFCRVFKKTHFNTREDLPGQVFWEVGSQRQRTSEDLTGCLFPGDYVGKGVAQEDFYLVYSVSPGEILIGKHYVGKSLPRGGRGRKIDRKFNQTSEQRIHCITTADCRIWVNDATGAVLVTERDREVYL